jgi:anti-anti-sigma factor
MVFTTSFENGIALAALPARLDGSNASQAEAELPSVLDPAFPLIFDARVCTYISSAGLRLLLVAAKRLVPLGRQVVIAGMAEQLIDIMRMTGFDHVFAFAKDLDEAAQLARAGG